MGITRRITGQQAGATAIEFAIVAPVLILLLFGIIEFSLMMFASSIIEGATANISRQSKTGADRSTAADPGEQAQEDTARLQQMILARGRGVLHSDKLTVVTRPDSSVTGSVGRAGEMVIYNVRYDWNIITPFLSSMLGDEDGIFTISSTTAVVNEPFGDD